MAGFGIMKNKYSLIKKIILLLIGIPFLCLSHPMRPIPWVTHQAVLFLEKFMNEHPHAKVLEFGSGSSTLWFAKRTKNLVSIEHALVWYEKLSEMLADDPAHHPIDYRLLARPYWTVCEEFEDETFDLILVDGRNRSGCIKHSIRILKRGGILMIDNAERHWYQKALRLLNGWKNIKTVQREPDSCGFTYPNWQTHWYIKP